MLTHRHVVVALAALLVSAGVGAAAVGPDTRGTGGIADVRAPDDPETYAAGATYENGTVTLTVTANGSAVGGFDVTADGAAVGTTDAEGTVAFAPANDSGTLVVTDGNVTGEFAYAVANGTVSLDGGFAAATADGDAVNATEGATARGTEVRLPGPASATASAVQEVIRLYRSGDFDPNTTLGEAVSAVATGAVPADVGKPADAGRPDGAGPSTNAGRPAHAGPPSDGADTNGTESDERGPDADRGKPAHAGGGDDEGDDDGNDRGAGDDGRGNGGRP